VIDDAIYAQCALLDEAALGTLTSADRDAWETEPLQVGQFNSHDAGQELITRIERRLAEPQPVLPLLALFNTVLGLGFKGKFALHSGDARTTLMQAVDERLGRASERDTCGPVVVTRGRGRPWFKDLSPLGWVATTLVVGAFAYVGIDRWLTASLPLAN
jgi:type VI secretion system protein ImpK